jgi:hypothetical protein
LRSSKAIVVIAVILAGGAFALGSIPVGRAYQEQRNYDRKLIESGITPSLQGIEDFIQATIQPGSSRLSVIDRLSLIGVVGHSGHEVPLCEELRIFLTHRPGDDFPFYVPPSTPPVYNINVCYANAVVSRVGDLMRVDLLNQ